MFFVGCFFLGPTPAPLPHRSTRGRLTFSGVKTANFDVGIFEAPTPQGSGVVGVADLLYNRPKKKSKRQNMQKKVQNNAILHKMFILQKNANFQAFGFYKK